MKFKLTALLFLCAIGMAIAQKKIWTLEECVTYAVENNLSIQQFELDLENATIDKSDAVGAFLPNLNGTLNGQSNTGLSFDPTNNQPVNTTQITSSGSVTSSAVLFNGLRNIHRLNRAKLNAIANQYRLDDLVNDIRLNVAINYLNILSNKEAAKVAKALYAVTEQDLKRTRELVESGVVARGDLLEIEATAATREQQIINAENDVLISRINLAQLLQITDYENFDISDTEFEVPPADILKNSPKDIFNKAISYWYETKFFETNVELAEKDLSIAKGAAYPTLSAFFNYNTRYSDQFLDPITGQVIPFKEQLWINDGIAFGAQINIPVFNGWSTRNNIKRSQIDVKKAELELEQNKLNLETNINQAYVDVINSSKAYDAALKTREARVLALDYSKERFDVGIMNSFDYSQSQARVDNAEAEVIRTKYDYAFRIKVLEFYFGLPIVID
ncbi:TolC family protein [uncultured Eudoraea sp.]|jgi:outer membrane protein|uniref:TolC family protein n=3 Tax=Eudoraea TaxID=446680 RepID=UPI002629F4FE|nr:TolC family protein [uncultured Eudoraea sp.]